MKAFVHPASEDINLFAVLGALSDPIRLKIFVGLVEQKSCMSCSQASPDAMAKSTLSHHFRILREAGLIRTTKRGVENRNVARVDEINARFPGLLKIIIKLAKQEYCPNK